MEIRFLMDEHSRTSWNCKVMNGVHEVFLYVYGNIVCNNNTTSQNTLKLTRWVEQAVVAVAEPPFNRESKKSKTIFGEIGSVMSSKYANYIKYTDNLYTFTLTFCHTCLPRMPAWALEGTWNRRKCYSFTWHFIVACSYHMIIAWIVYKMEREKENE